MNSEKQMTTDNHQMKSWGKHCQSGFSMVEVMVAILLLTVGLLALAKMQTQAVASNSYGNQLTEATFLAQDKLEELRLLNECYLAVIAKPELSWTAEDQIVVNNYNSQLSDSVANWSEIDTDSDSDDDPMGERAFDRWSPLGYRAPIYEVPRSVPHVNPFTYVPQPSTPTIYPFINI